MPLIERERKPGASTPLSMRGFRRVWVGNTVSVAGDSASWIALVALCLGTSHVSLPLLVVLYTAPVAVGGLAAGWALDRFDRRRLPITDSLVRGGVFASIPIAGVLARPTAVQLYLVAGVYGLLKMLNLAGFPSLIPQLVPESQLDQANALEGAGFGLASLACPLRTSIVVAQLAAAGTILILLVHSTGATILALVSLGVCSAPMTAWAQSLRMRIAPPQTHGRLFALLRTTMQATPPWAQAQAP